MKVKKICWVYLLTRIYLLICQGRIFCYRETLEKNIMISGMDYKCANELVEYLSVPITEDELRIKIIKLLGKDADEILELMISQELIEKCG